MTRAADPQTSFADLEFFHQGVQLDPLLQAVSTFLDTQADLVERVRQDLERGLKQPQTGRRGVTPSQALRSLVLMRVKNWDYRELAERIADGYTLRGFTHFFSQRVPAHDAFHRACCRLTPEVLRAINDRVVHAAVDLRLEDGQRLRVDTTVVQTDIHHPTDNTLLWDVVRVVTRLVGDLHTALPEGVTGFTNRTRAARRRMLAIQRMTSKERQQQQTAVYRDLIQITEQVVANARRVLEPLRRGRRAQRSAAPTVSLLMADIDHYCQLGRRVIDQTRRRVLDGEQVPTAEKIYSIFEPHTDLIKRGKVQTPIEFGHKVFLAESARGLITQYRVLEGNPSDEDHVAPSIDRHRDTFGHPPDLYSSDRGFYSAANVHTCEQAGVTVVCIPQRGGKKTTERAVYEKSADFKKGQRFRAGIEGRISVLFRGRGMKRALAEGRERFEVLVGAAVLANNLLTIARLLTHASKKNAKTHRRRAA
jgi:IS5 family transposase